MRSILGIFGFSLFGGVFAALGPLSNLYIANKNIAPDGFNRSYVLLPVHISSNSIILPSGVLAGATQKSVQFPGPFIFGFKV